MTAEEAIEEEENDETERNLKAGESEENIKEESFKQEETKAHCRLTGIILESHI